MLKSTSEVLWKQTIPLEIVDNSQLHLDLYVYEKDLSKLKVGQTIHFHPPTNNAGKEFDAKFSASATPLSQHQSHCHTCTGGRRQNKSH